MINNCLIIGELVNDPEERAVGQKSVLNLRVKTWETSNGQRYDAYHTVQIWGERAKDNVRNCSVGQLVMCQGKYTTRKVEKNGQTAYYSSLTAFNVEKVSAEGISQGGQREATGYGGAGNSSRPPVGSGHGPVDTGNPAPSSNGVSNSSNGSNDVSDWG